MPFNYFAHNLTLMGSVTSRDPEEHCFSVMLQNGQEQTIYVSATTSYQVVRNLDGLDLDRVPDPPGAESEDAIAFKIRKYIQPQCLVATLGVYQEHEGTSRYDARTVCLMHSRPEKCEFEETHWWVTQISRLADQWLDQLFGDRRDYKFADFVERYTTSLNIIGLPMDDPTQEMATLSRLLYGLSSAYLLTGSERYLTAAKAGVQFQRETFRHLSHDGIYCFWASGRKKLRYITQLYEASQSGDDFNTIPLYEQIYALAGLTQYYRITLDWRVLEDIHRTVRTFNDFYLDGRQSDPLNPQPKAPDGYFSHLDYATMRPDADSLGINKSKKNWNSIGDHLPAYLINLILALDPLPQGHPNTPYISEFLEKCKWMLEHTSDLICEHFPDKQSRYVNERFFENWKPDHGYSWQQNRGIVGHNLKIAWNLTRVANYYYTQAAKEHKNDKCRSKADRCMEIATRLADDMALYGVDQIRGGCFDAMERVPTNGMPIEFAWSSTKDFWQQEQAILAYLILHGTTQDDTYKKLARRMMAFWNLFFLDHDYNGIYFRTSDDGVPIVTGGYGIKGGHSISGYHAFELNFLAHLYIRSFISPGEKSQEQNYVLYFKPDEDCGQLSLNVLPDFFPPGMLRLKSVSVGGQRREGEPRQDFQIDIPNDQLGNMVIAEFESKPMKPVWSKKPQAHAKQDGGHEGVRPPRRPRRKTK
jgi:mannose/cellobiose epimerase-like protein (N-acyl-D-glucosamine 2-epimerase family)